MEKRRIALLGNSLILESLGERLRRFPQNEVMGFPSGEAEKGDIAAMKPEVIIFDLDSARPKTAFSLLESGPELVLIGVSSDSNVVKVWTGRQMREMSIRDLLKVIHEEERNPPAFPTHGNEIHQMTRRKNNSPNNKC